MRKSGYYWAKTRKDSRPNVVFVCNSGRVHKNQIWDKGYNTVEDFYWISNDPIEEPSVPPKPAELTLDEKVDDLIDELMKDNRVKAIKRLMSRDKLRGLAVFILNYLENN